VSADMMRVSVAGGKYTVVQDAAGKLLALRYGEEWRDCVGDNLIRSLAAELDEARQWKAGIADLLREASDTVSASTLEEDISDTRRQYRANLAAKLRQAHKEATHGH
jgi:hypothetical protein